MLQATAKASELLAHAAMDAVEAVVDSSASCWLGVVDRMSECIVYAHATMGATILVVCTDKRDDAIKIFCAQAHDLYTKALLNPLQKPGAVVWSSKFRAAIIELAASRLRLVLK